MVSNNPITELQLNQASTLDNIILSASGHGFRSRLGDSAFNSSAMVSSSTPVHGLGYFRKAAQSEFLLAVAGTKVFVSSALSGTMSDITGSLTITAGQDLIWSFATLNDKVVAFGGLDTAPDAPFTYTGSGNATALAGTPPLAYGCFQANNRIFAYRTSTGPSTIYWSILGNEADWTGTGSGSSDVWTSNNDRLTAHAVINTASVLLFKENSIHQMQIAGLIEGAFPIFPLFDGTGCAGKGAVVVADGMVYFINSRGKMCVTDGSRLFTNKELPALADIDDQWNMVNPDRYRYIQGVRHIGKDFDHIKWFVSYGGAQTTNNRCFIWDRLNNCWLQNTTGSTANVVANTSQWQLYDGQYNGKIYSLETAGQSTDDSNSSAVIAANWTSGWINRDKFETIKQPRKMTLSFLTQDGGSISVNYSFDSSDLTKTNSINQTAEGSVFDVDLFDVGVFAGSTIDLQSFRIVGRGNFFQFRINSPTTAFPLVLNGITISGKEYGQKEFSAR